MSMYDTEPEYYGLDQADWHSIALLPWLWIISIVLACVTIYTLGRIVGYVLRQTGYTK